MNDAPVIGLYTEDGKLKTKEEFLNEMTQLYNDCTEKQLMQFDFLDYLIKPETQINPDSTYATFNFLNRSFYINDEITQETAEKVHQFIAFWNEVEAIDGEINEETMHLTLYINSLGGDLDAAFSIISSMQSSKIPIDTVVYGRSWSAAFLISICGDYRYASKYATFMFHEGSALYGENAHKFIQFSEFYKQTLLEVIKNITISNTKITSDVYQLHKNDDWWLTSQDALGYGIVDKIIEKEDIKK